MSLVLQAVVFCMGMGNPWVFCGFFHEYGYGYENSYLWKTHTHGHGSQVFPFLEYML
jgi:hypothetical protein